MKRATIAGGLLLLALLLLGAAALLRRAERAPEPAAATGPAAVTDPAAALAPAAAPAGAAAAPHPALLYGRVVTTDGATYEGRLRWGGDEEALWSHFFNGAKADNPWARHLPPERRVERRPFGIFGLELGRREREIDLARPFMVRFGELARIEARGGLLLATLKSGTTVELDRFGADDFADGLRIWDRRRGVVDLDEGRMLSVELLAGAGSGPGTAAAEPAPAPLFGTVRTATGRFTGPVQWNRRSSLSSDELVGRGPDGSVRLPFDAVRSIVRRGRDGSVVTLADGRELALSDTADVAAGNRGVAVDDGRYGRVLVSWDAFERLDLHPDAGAELPGYDDFPPGRPLHGTVTTRSGRRLAGRLVFDLDESETSETLDAPDRGVDFTIPFGRIVAIALPAPGGTRGPQGGRRAEVTLRGGERLELDLAGDLGGGNGGLLVFGEGGSAPEHVPWVDVARIELAG